MNEEREYTARDAFTNRGRSIKPGDKVWLTQQKVDWLREQGIRFDDDRIIVPRRRTVAAAQQMPARRVGGCAGCGR